MSTTVELPDGATAELKDQDELRLGRWDYS